MINLVVHTPANVTPTASRPPIAFGRVLPTFRSLVPAPTGNGQEPWDAPSDVTRIPQKTPITTRVHGQRKLQGHLGQTGADGVTVVAKVFAWNWNKKKKLCLDRLRRETAANLQHNH